MNIILTKKCNESCRADFLRGCDNNDASVHDTIFVLFALLSGNRSVLLKGTSNQFGDFGTLKNHFHYPETTSK